MPQRFIPRNWTKAIKFNGSSFYLGKANPAGLATGTQGRYWMGLVILNNTSLQALFQFKVTADQSPAGLLGQIAGTYYIAVDTTNPANNLTISADDFRRFFPVGVPMHVCYYIDNTNLLVYVNGVLVITKTWVVPINTAAYNAIFQGRITDSAGTGLYYLNGFQKNTVWGNGAPTVAEINEHRLRGTPPKSAVSWHEMEDDSDSTFTRDLIGTNNLTLNGNSFSPEAFANKRKSVNDGLIKNSDMSQQPYFVAATNTPDRTIDGTAGGSGLGINTYNWKIAATSVFAGGTGYSARFARVGDLPCIRLVSVGKIWKSGATVTQMVIGHTAYTGPTLTAIDRFNLYKVKPGVQYVISMDYWNNQLDAGITPSITAVIYDAALNRIDTQTQNAATDVSTAWRSVERTITIPAGGVYIAVTGRVAAGGVSDFDTGNCDVAFRNIQYAPVTPLARQTANGRRAGFIEGTPSRQASTTFTVEDYEFLGGHPAELRITITDWTQMSGGEFTLVQMDEHIPEGVGTFLAEVSNHQTALNFMEFVNANLGDPGENPASVEGDTIILTLPGGNNGFEITWSQGGVDTSEATATGGIDLTVVAIGGGDRTFVPDGTEEGEPSAIQVGTSNEECAANLAAAFDGFTTLVEGNRVTFYWPFPGTAGNGQTVEISGREDGETSGGLLTTGDFAGGSELVSGLTRQSVTP